MKPDSFEDQGGVSAARASSLVPGVGLAAVHPEPYSS